MGTKRERGGVERSGTLSEEVANGGGGTRGGSRSFHTMSAATALDFAALLKVERQRRRASTQQSLADTASPDNRCSFIKPRPLLDLSRYRVDCGIADIYLIPNWIDNDEATAIKKAIKSIPGKDWNQVGQRKTHIAGGTPHPTYGMIPVPLAPPLEACCKAMVQQGLFSAEDAPNHVLLNWYEECAGISPHKDGPLYQNRVGILSIGTRTDTLDFWDISPFTSPRPDPICRIVCPPNSLIIFTSDAYETHWHGIIPQPEQNPPDSYRLSLTMRRVLKLRDEFVLTAEQRDEEERRRIHFARGISDL